MPDAELSDTLFRITCGRLRLLRAEVACAQLPYSIQDACGTEQIVCDSMDHLTGLERLTVFRLMCACVCGCVFVCVRCQVPLNVSSVVSSNVSLNVFGQLIHVQAQSMTHLVTRLMTLDT